MTRKNILRSGVAYGIGMVIANIIGSYFFQTVDGDLLHSIVISIVGVAALTALLYSWTSPQEPLNDLQ
jgi:uncharacterized membrane protein YfcA